MKICRFATCVESHKTLNTIRFVITFCDHLWGFKSLHKFHRRGLRAMMSTSVEQCDELNELWKRQHAARFHCIYTFCTRNQHTHRQIFPFNGIQPIHGTHKNHGTRESETNTWPTPSFSIVPSSFRCSRILHTWHNGQTKHQNIIINPGVWGVVFCCKQQQQTTVTFDPLCHFMPIL